MLEPLRELEKTPKPWTHPQRIELQPLGSEPRHQYGKFQSEAKVGTAGL